MCLVAHRMRASATGLAAALAVAFMSFPALDARVLAAGDVSAPNVVKQTNDVRSKNGLGRLTVDPLLMKAAQAKADDMAARGYFAHQTPDGRMPWDWIAAVGYEFAAAAENLAVGYPTDDDLISAWMESEGHRHNLLNQKYTDIGIGVARGRYKGQDTIFVVQMFGKPRGVAPRAVLAATPILLLPDAAPAVPLESTALPVDAPSDPAPVLESVPLVFEPTDLPAVDLPSTDILIDPLAPLAVPLIATDIPLDLLVDQTPLPCIRISFAVELIH